MPKITTEFLDGLLSTATGQKIYRDDEVRGFGVRVTPKSRAFIVEKRVGGVARRFTLGKCADMSLELARKRAEEVLSQIAKGIDPDTGNAVNKNAWTLSQVLQEYCEVRPLREKTRKSYRNTISRCLPDWLNLPINSITKDMIEVRHRNLSGRATADGVMHILSALVVFAAERYSTDDEPFIKSNPVSRLWQIRAWHKPVKRQRTIPDHKLADWHRAVSAMKNGNVRDCLLMMLMTGMRGGECRSLRWDYINFAEGVILVPGAVSSDNHDHRHYLSDFLRRFLSNRYSRRYGCAYVFPGQTSQGHICNVPYYIADLRRQLGFNFSADDVRRTFFSVAGSLEVPHYILRRLGNHHGTVDVTQSYIYAPPELMQKYMNEINAELLKLMEYDAPYLHLRSSQGELYHQLKIPLPT